MSDRFSLSSKLEGHNTDIFYVSRIAGTYDGSRNSRTVVDLQDFSKLRYIQYRRGV